MVVDAVACARVWVCAELELLCAKAGAAMHASTTVPHANNFLMNNLLL